jgi:hypothetical protein
MEEDIIIRIKLQDLRKVKRYLRPYPNESMAHYFQRLAVKLNNPLKEM